MNTANAVPEDQRDGAEREDQRDGAERKDQPVLGGEHSSGLGCHRTVGTRTNQRYVQATYRSQAMIRVRYPAFNSGIGALELGLCHLIFPDLSLHRCSYLSGNG